MTVFFGIVSSSFGYYVILVHQKTPISLQQRNLAMYEDNTTHCMQCYRYVDTTPQELTLDTHTEHSSHQRVITKQEFIPWHNYFASISDRELLLLTQTKQVYLQGGAL
jgi:hypothetical protein